MSLSLFGWIRTRARNAMLAGIADAVDQLAESGEDDGATAIATLRLTLAPPPVALPAPETTDAAPVRKTRKGE